MPYHITIFVNIVSFTLSVTILGIVLYIMPSRKSILLRNFLFHQIVITICITANLIFEYLIANTPGNTLGMATWYVGTFLWGPFFFYYSMKYIAGITRIHLSRTQDGALKAIAASIGFAVVIPFSLSHNLEGVSVILARETYLIVLPACLFIGGTSFTAMSFRFPKMGNSFIRQMMQSNMRLNGIMIPVLFFLFFLNLKDGTLSEKKLKLAIDLYFLLWNLQFLNYRRFFKNGVRMPVYPKDGTTREMAVKVLTDAEIEGNSRFFGNLKDIMEREKPFLDPDMTLGKLSKILDINRNNLSFIINQQTGNSFNAFLNGYRVKEAKSMLDSPSCPKILEVAYSAGFNSKSAFYDAFKKETGQTPSDYIPQTNA